MRTRDDVSRESPGLTATIRFHWLYRGETERGERERERERQRDALQSRE
jgi:hypothetical protein